MTKDFKSETVYLMMKAGYLMGGWTALLMAKKLALLSLPKCPLGVMYNHSIKQRILGRELGLVIDLTNTSRYYDMLDWTAKGINFLKINCKGRDEVPDKASVTKFVDEAINIFARARLQESIKRTILMHCTLMLYHETKPEVLFCPQTPEWKSSDPHPNCKAVPNQVDQRYTSSNAVANLRFPGLHPVSLNREKLQLLRQSYYYASWKADGTWYMMLIMCDACYLVRFPRRQTNKDMAGKTHHYTLLDGEMIIDIDRKMGKQERRYLIYDLMALNKKSVIVL